MLCGPSGGAPHLRAMLEKAECIWSWDWHVCVHVAICAPIASPCYFSIDERWRQCPPTLFPMIPLLKGWSFCAEGGEGLIEKLFKVSQRAKPSCSQEIELWRSVGKGFLPLPHHNAVCLKFKKKNTKKL